MKRSLYVLAGAAVIFFAGFATGKWGIPGRIPDAIHTSAPTPATSDGKQMVLTNPRLDCTPLQTVIPESSLRSFNTDVTDYINSEKAAGLLLNASVYYRDLNNGPSMLVGGSETYSAASLLKVPLALSFYKKAESNPGFLDATTTYTPNPVVTDETQPYAPPDNIVAGQTYTTRQLIATMLEQSSNEAAAALIGLLSRQDIVQVYQDLGLPTPTFSDDYVIKVKDYSSFLGMLFNATYLNRADSQTILSLLTQASYKDGLVAGVPSTVTVAHKFGSRGLPDHSVQLSDCGIVYLSTQPYSLCVMTHGWDFTTLSGIIRHISELTYQYAAAD